MKKLGSLVWSLTLACGVAGASTGAEREAALSREVAALRPGHDAWRHGPWRTCLQEARREAHRRGRPLLLWALGGDPAGRC